jgi:hypothetical protein
LRADGSNSETYSYAAATPEPTAASIAFVHEKENVSLESMSIDMRMLIYLSLVSLVVTSAYTNTITVTNTDDSGSGSLRQALADANDDDTIDFAVTGTIGLTSGELLVNKSITVSGPGAETFAVNGNAKSRVFHIGSGKTVSILGLTITNGYTTGYGGGIRNEQATLTLNSCTISNNSSSSNAGGAIHNDAENMGHATLVINDCLVINNSGGGIYNDGVKAGTATLEITDSILANNYSGNAIYNRGFDCIFCGNGTATVQISNSSITGNSPAAAIFSAGQQCCYPTILLDSSTVNGNSGTAVYNTILSSLVVSNSAISGNSDGGIYNDAGSNGSDISNSTMNNNGVEIRNYGGPLATLENTIFEVGPGGHSIVSDGSSTVQSFGYNLSSDDGGGYLTGPGDQINVNPLLGPLQDNGGPTFTHELLPGSPAINAGDPNFVPPPDYDQRGAGYYRVRNGRLDIGSFEVQTAPRPSPTPRVHPTPRVRPTPR